MELLAFTHHYLAYEESIVNPDAYTIRRLGDWKLPSSAWVGLISTIMALAILSDAASAKTAYVATNGYRLNVRSGPGVQHAWMNVLADGQQIDISDRTANGWVQLTNGNWVAGGYIRQNQVASQAASQAASQVAYVATGGYRANKRSGAGTQNGVVGSLNDGDRIELMSRQSNGWVQLTDGSWIAGNLIRYEGQPAPPSSPIPSPDTAFLQRDSRGDRVVNLQNRLKALGYIDAAQNSTGFYGTTTEQAVKAFQQKNGLAIDGIAGPNTLAALQGAGAIPATAPTQAALTATRLEFSYTIKPEVARLQDRLKALGYFDPAVRSSGQYLEITQGAVRNFQQRNGLFADGIAGPETLTAIYSNTALRADQPLPGAGLDLGGAGSEGLVGMLRLNSSGPQVVRLQTRLKELSYLAANFPIDGFYGPGTEQAVIEFQQQHRLAGDGVAGPRTLNILYGNSAVVSDKAVLEWGSQGPEVTDLQNRLKALNYYPAAKASDGYFDLTTQQAVREFQQKHGLPVDGVARPSMVELLRSGRALAAAAGVSTSTSLSTPTSTGRMMRVTTSGSDLLVREGPGQTYRVISYLVNGTAIGTTGRTSNGWIELEGGGWVSGDLVR